MNRVGRFYQLEATSPKRRPRPREQSEQRQLYKRYSTVLIHSSIASICNRYEILTGLIEKLFLFV